MTEKLQLEHPWLIAVWPGMGHVALNAGFYLLARLGMNAVAEYEAGDLFDVDQVEVKGGIIQPVRHPRNRFFVWSDPAHRHDLVVFLGEAQPPIGKYALCRKIIAYAQELHVERVFTFAAMATQMRPEHRSRVFAAATDSHQLPYPKASQAILEVFTTITGIKLDFTELAEQVRVMDQQLGELLARVEQAYGPQFPDQEEGYSPEPAEEEPIGPARRQHIEALFQQAAKDRAKAFELKQELDRLGVFKEYEDRFLDLFKKPG
jgi:proteasome assembly chaperone (PAC2) family protein